MHVIFNQDIKNTEYPPNLFIGLHFIVIIIVVIVLNFYFQFKI